MLHSMARRQPKGRLSWSQFLNNWYEQKGFLTTCGPSTWDGSAHSSTRGDDDDV